MQVMMQDEVPMIQELGGYVTAIRAAEMLGINLSQVYWAVNHGKLRAARLDKRTWLIKKTSIERYKRQREREMVSGDVGDYARDR